MNYDDKVVLDKEKLIELLYNVGDLIHVLKGEQLKYLMQFVVYLDQCLEKEIM